jgi:cytosine/adenosine deaminase-related metal-dependent hydrolase
MTLIAAEWLVVSSDQPPLAEHGLVVEGGLVVEVGPNADLAKRHPHHSQVAGGIVAPGFVDTHMHLYGVLAHGIPLDAAPAGFWSFLDDFWWPRVEDALDHGMIAAATEWVCAELLASGVTTFFDILEAPCALPDALLVQRQVVTRMGNRAVLSFEATERAGTGRLGLDENTRLIEECRKSDGLVSGMMSFHTTFTCSEAFIHEAFDRAADLDVLCHAHVNEGTHEPEWCLEHLGMRTFEMYERMGVASDRFLASQCVQLSEAERRIISERGVRCAHMPLSNCEVGGGIAPVPELLASGVTVGLGTDGYITDFTEVMRGAFLVHKARLLDPTVMPAAVVLGMATEGGARALGLDRVGRLEPGWAADLQIVAADLPTPIRRHNLFDQLVLWRNRSHVTDVMVAGEWRVRGGEVVGFDRQRARARLGEQAERLWART